MEIIETYIDTDGKKWTYYKNDIYNGPTHLSFIEIKCLVCNLPYSDDKFYRLTNGVPGYWKGGHPERPQEAEGFYCGPLCSQVKYCEEHH